MFVYKASSGGERRARQSDPRSFSGHPANRVPAATTEIPRRSISRVNLLGPVRMSTRASFGPPSVPRMRVTPALGIRVSPASRLCGWVSNVGLKFRIAASRPLCMRNDHECPIGGNSFGAPHWAGASNLRPTVFRGAQRFRPGAESGVGAISTFREPAGRPLQESELENAPRFQQIVCPAR